MIECKWEEMGIYRTVHANFHQSDENSRTISAASEQVFSVADCTLEKRRIRAVIWYCELLVVFA